MFPALTNKPKEKKDFQKDPIGSEQLGISFGNFERSSLWRK